MKYINRRGELKDAKIAEHIRKAADLYENGAILEAREILWQIADAIDKFTAGQEEIV